MQKEKSKFAKDGYFYFFILLICIIILGAISLLSSPVFSCSASEKLLDSLNSSSSVYFDFGSSEIKPESYILLDKLSETLKSSPGAKLEISGHTDNIGGDEFNLNLSEKRAEVVKAYLVSKGCNGEQIITIAKGKYEPLNSNLNEDDRAVNRRVEFKWITPVTADDKPNDIEYVNSSITKTGRSEIEGEISARDTTGEPIKDIEEKDVNAVLKWKEDSAGGTVHFLPIDGKKKIAYTLVLDYSPSMFGSNTINPKIPKGKKIEQMEMAVKSFINLISLTSFVKVIKFGWKIDIIQKFTKSKEIMLKAVDARSYPREGTALFKAIYTSLLDTSYNSNPTVMKTVIAFTDGMDNLPGITKDSIYSLSNQNGIKVYTIGLLDKNDEYSTDEERRHGAIDLKEIAGRTGGFFYYAKDAEVLAKIYNQIFNQISGSYKISIKWNEDKLPPKGTSVTACISVNVKGTVRTFFKDYIME